MMAVRWVFVVVGAVWFGVTLGSGTAFAKCAVPKVVVTISHDVSRPIRRYRLNSSKMEVLDAANSSISRAAGLTRGHSTEVAEWDKIRCPQALYVTLKLTSELFVANELRNKKCLALATSHARAHADQFGEAVETDLDYLVAAITNSITPLAAKTRKYTKDKYRQANWAVPIVAAVDQRFAAIEMTYKKLATEYHKTVIGKWKSCRNPSRP